MSNFSTATIFFRVKIVARALDIFYLHWHGRYDVVRFTKRFLYLHKQSMRWFNA